MGSVFTRNDSLIQKDVNGGAYLKTPDIYDATIVRAAVNKTARGAVMIDFTFKFDGLDGEKTIYGLCYSSADPSKTPPGTAKFNSLLAILGIKDAGDPVSTQVNIKTENGEKTLDLQVLPPLAGKKVKVGIELKYDRYNGEIKEKWSVNRFYRLKDGASGAEIISNKDFGKQIEKDTPYTQAVKYEVGITPELVESWKAEKRVGRSTAPKASPFSQKQNAEYDGADCPF